MRCNTVNTFLTRHRPVSCSSFSGYLVPSILIFEAALSISRRSSGVSSIASAPMFSSRRVSFVVPGIGTIHGCPEQRSHFFYVFWRAIGKTHPHTPEPDSGNFETAFPQYTFFHCLSSLAFTALYCNNSKIEKL